MVVTYPSLLCFFPSEENPLEPIDRSAHAVKDRTGIKTGNFPAKIDIMRATEHDAVGRTIGQVVRKGQHCPACQTALDFPCKTRQGVNGKTAVRKRIDEPTKALALHCMRRCQDKNVPTYACGRSNGRLHSYYGKGIFFTQFPCAKRRHGITGKNCRVYVKRGELLHRPIDKADDLLLLPQAVRSVGIVAIVIILYLGKLTHTLCENVESADSAVKHSDAHR